MIGAGPHPIESRDDLSIAFIARTRSGFLEDEPFECGLRDDLARAADEIDYCLTVLRIGMKSGVTRGGCEGSADWIMTDPAAPVGPQNGPEPSIPRGSPPTQPPMRPERHVPSSLTTIRRRLTLELARNLLRCPCCARALPHTPHW